LQITRTVVCDPCVLKQGVRYIFALDGTMVTDVDQLIDGQSYVCSSSAVYKRLDYESITGVDWVSTNRKVSTPAVVRQTESFLSQLNQRQQNYHYVGPFCFTLVFLLARLHWRH